MLSWRGAAPRGERSSRSVRSGRSVTQSRAVETSRRTFAFPKEVRLLRSADFEKVYKEGFRISGPYFAAFCLRCPGQSGPKVGLTVPRSLGKSTVRNRIKRRVREAVRLNLWRLGPEWAVVFNPRSAALEAPFRELEREVQKVFARCV